MTVRRESVVLDLDDRVSPGLLRVAAAAEVADKAVEGLGKQQTSTSRSTRELEGDTERLSQSVERNASSIDKYSGRLGLLINALAAVGPAAIPITAVAIPAVTTLGSNLVSLGLGVGVTELAFHGLGSTLEKFNKAQAQPTATNIAAAQLAMDALPPSAQRLVLELHRLTPLFDKLRQDAAGGGLTAGVTDGLHSLLEDTPLVRTAVRGISAELGDMARESGHALASNQWKPFLRFAGQEAPRDLHIMGAATGDVAHGLAEILMAFGGLDHKVGDGILRLAQDFDHWATSLGKTKDFQSFVQYIETNGPRVVSLVGDLGQLFVDLVQAAAPLGGPTVQALDEIVKLLDAIASSPLGTPLILLAQVNAILSLTSRALVGLGVNATIGFGGITKGAAQSKGALAGVRAEATGLWATMKQIGSNVGRNASTGTPLLAGVSKEQVGSLAKAGLQGAGLIAIASGAADKIGLANTATLALAGSFAGPLGAAAGAAVGFISDVSQTTDQMTAAIKTSQQAIDDWDLAAEKQATDAAQSQVDQIFSNRSSLAHGNLFKLPSVVKAGVSQITSGTPQKLIDQAGAGFTAQGVQATELGKIYDQLAGKASNVELSQAQLQGALVRVQPAMSALGISTNDLTSAYAANDGSFDTLVQRLVRYTNQAESTKGQTEAVASAFADMSNQALTADQRLQALSTSLDAALDPKINLSAARDALQQGLNDLDKNLSKTTKSLHGQSDAVIQNRAAIRTQVSGIKDLIEKQAAANPNVGRLTATLKDQRQKLLDAGQAAGISKKDMQDYINELGLTPKFVKTTIQLTGTQAANGALSYLKSQLVGLDGRVFSTTIKVTREGSTTVSTGGRTVDIPKSHADGGTVGGAARGGMRRFSAAGRTRGYADGGSVYRGSPTDPHLKHPLFTHEGPHWYKAAYKHGRPFAKDGPASWDWPYQTGFANQRQANAFQHWVRKHDVPFDLNAKHVDYDMRGYWKKTGGKGWHKGSHFPDTFKTPYDTTFSHESKYATKDNPFYWRGAKLIDRRSGQVVFAPAAEGMTIPGERMPYGDKVLIWAAPGEEIITNRNGEADDFRADRASGRIPAYADGGSIATHATSSPAGQSATDGGVGAAASAAARGLHDLQAASGSLTKQIAAEQAERQKVAQERAQQVSTVTGNFRSQIFGAAADDIWGAGSSTDPRAILRGDIRDARTYREDVLKLRRRGLRNGALGQVQTLAEAQQALGLPRGELGDITELFQRRQRASHLAGVTSGDLLDAKQLASMDRHLQTLHHDLSDVKGELRRHRAQAHKDSHDNAANVAKGVNGAVTSGTQRRHP